MKRHVTDWRKLSGTGRRFGERKLAGTAGIQTPQNSAPWLENPPQTIADLIHVSDAIAEVKKQWGLPPIDS